MVKVTSLSVFCFLLGGCATSTDFQTFVDFNNDYKVGENRQVIAFVGEKIGVYSVPYEEWCGVGYICLDQRLNARYRVIQVLEGAYDYPTIDFAVYDHGIIRTPFWRRQDRMIIYVGQYNGQLVHEKYQYDVLSPLKNGGFAFCGDPYAWYEPSEIETHGREKLVPFNFYPPIREKISDFLPGNGDEQDEFQDDVREDFIAGMRVIAPPAYNIANMVATCRMGMSAASVSSIRMEYEFDPERQQAELRERCWEKSGLSDEGTTNKQLEDSGFNRCVKNSQ